MDKITCAISHADLGHFAMCFAKGDRRSDGAVDIPSETIFHLYTAFPSPNPRHKDRITCAISLVDLGHFTVCFAKGDRRAVGLLTSHPRPFFIASNKRISTIPQSNAPNSVSNLFDNDSQAVYPLSKILQLIFLLMPDKKHRRLWIDQVCQPVQARVDLTVSSHKSC